MRRMAEFVAWDDGARRLPETTRVARILDIIWRVSAAPRQWTRQRLAEAFEVSERMITEDLQIIRNRLRFDVRSERGQGYYFVSVPQLPSVTYSVPEALALILAAVAGRQNPGIPQGDLASAIARLASVIPEELRAVVQRHADGADGARDPYAHRRRMVAACGQGALTRRALDIVYSAASRGGAETRRRVDPWAVFPYDRSWLMVGYCHLRQERRVFKLDRIKSVALLDASFEPPPNFDLQSFLAGGWGIMRGLDSPVEDVTLRFSPTAARWIVDEEWHPSQRLEHGADGTMTFRVTIQITPEFQRWVLRFGRDVEVIGPASLRDWLRDEARAMLARLDAPVVAN